MKKTFTFFICDILDNIKKIRKFTDGLSFEEFEKNDEKIYSVSRAFEIIGEAVSHIPLEVKENFPNIKWNQIKNFRNIISHYYWGVEVELEWEVIQNKLDDLEMTCEKMLDKYKK